LGLEPPKPEVAAPAAATPGAPAPPEPSKAGDLPDFAKKAYDLDEIKKAVDEAASVGGGLWLSYLFVLFYLAVAAGAVTHEDLFFERAVKLPFLNIELPLLAFFFLAPILFIIVHAYTLVHLVFLTEKAKRYHQALYDPARGVDSAARQNLQWRLPSNIFIQFLAGPSSLRRGAFGWLLRAIAWVTLAVAPVLLLLMMQVQFLPFHSSFIAWTQRVALVVDLVLIWWLWGKILAGREADERRLVPSEGTAIGLVLSGFVILFSWTAATFPGEWQEKHWPDGRPFLTTDEFGKLKEVSLHDWVFNSTIDNTTRRRRLPLSSTLVLPGLNIYEGLAVDDPQKTRWRDIIFHARGRDLKGAIFISASLPKVDFTGAQLQGARFLAARLQGAWLDYVQLRSAELTQAQLQGASLENAQLQRASLFRAQLQGASLIQAQLQGASLDNAQLQGADLTDAQLQGASLAGAQLQGTSLQQAILQATDLSKALLWRTNLTFLRLGGVDLGRLAAVRLSDSPDRWLPSWKDNQDNVQPWNDETYQHLRQMVGSLPMAVVLDAALENIRRLDCANNDETLSSCDPLNSWIPPLAPPPEDARWRRALEDARVDDAAYAKALAAELKTLVCAGGDDAEYVLSGAVLGDPIGATPFNTRMIGTVVGAGRIAATSSEAPALVDFIMSKDCPLSNALTGADKAELLYIKENAPKKPGG